MQAPCCKIPSLEEKKQIARVQLFALISQEKLEAALPTTRMTQYIPVPPQFLNHVCTLICFYRKNSHVGTFTWFQVANVAME